MAQARRAKGPHKLWQHAVNHVAEPGRGRLGFQLRIVKVADFVTTLWFEHFLFVDSLKW